MSPFPPSFLSNMLRQTVSYKAITARDQRDQPTFATPTTVKARWRAVTREIIGPQGEVVSVAYKAILNFMPNVGDEINGREVIAVGTLTTVAGVEIGAYALTR